MTAPATVQPAASPPNRVPLLLGVLAVMVVLFAVSRLVGGGDDNSGTDAGQTAAAPTTAPPPPASAPPPAAPPPVETFEVFDTKNPFQPLRGTAAPGPAGSSAPSTRAGATSSPAAPPAATGAAGRTTSGQGSSKLSGVGTEPRRGERVALLDVFEAGGRTVANVRVNDTAHKVGPGDEFAGSYKVVSLSRTEGCGRFLFGDDQFRLCRGEEIRK